MTRLFPDQASTDAPDACRDSEFKRQRVGNDLAMGPAWAAAGDIGERYAGTVGGAMNMLASLTAAVAAIVTGTLFHHHLLTAPFVLFAVSYALGALCWLGVDVTRTVAEE